MPNTISLTQSSLLLTRPEGSAAASAAPDSSVVLFLPGISGGAFSDRFLPLVTLCQETDFPIARLHAWEGEADVAQHTYAHYQTAVLEAIEYLREQGYRSIIGVGKSFGGGLLLSIHHEALTQKILWAPAIGWGEVATLNALCDTPLRELADLKELQLSATFVAEDPAHIAIIHGTADTAFPIETSVAIATACHGDLTKIPEAGHSFKEPGAEAALLAATRDSLTRS